MSAVYEARTSVYALHVAACKALRAARKVDETRAKFGPARSSSARHTANVWHSDSTQKSLTCASHLAGNWSVDCRVVYTETRNAVVAWRDIDERKTSQKK